MTLSLAFIEGIGGPELMMIMFIVLLLFGANRLPELARGIGKSVREFKKAASGVEEEVRRAMMEIGDEVREAVDNFNREQQRARGARVNVDVQYEPAPAATAAPPSQEALIRERTAVLQMVAAGKITPDQAERLLDALGG